MNLYEYNEIKMDSTTWNQVLHFLEKGAELNDSNCIKTLYDIYKKGKGGIYSYGDAILQNR